MTAKRMEFSKQTRAEMIARCNMKCEAVLVLGGQPCGAALRKGKYEFHHIKEANEGGTNKADNGWVVCARFPGACHHTLTGRYSTARAKAERVKSRDTGTKPPSKNPLPNGRNSATKATIGAGKEPRKSKHSSHLSHLPRRNPFSGEIVS